MCIPPTLVELDGKTLAELASTPDTIELSKFSILELLASAIALLVVWFVAVTKQ